MKLAMILAEDEGYTFLSGPTFFLGLIVICFLMMVTVAIRDWWAKRQANKDEGGNDDDEDTELPGDDLEAVETKTVNSKAEKKQAAHEVKQQKKEAKEAKKKEKAAAKAEAKAAKAAKKAKKKKK